MIVLNYLLCKFVYKRILSNKPFYIENRSIKIDIALNEMQTVSCTRKHEAETKNRQLQSNLTRRRPVTYDNPAKQLKLKSSIEIQMHGMYPSEE